MTEYEPEVAPSELDEIVAAVRRIQQEEGKLPSERDLAEQLNVKRHQLRKALEALRRVGDLEPARSKRAVAALPRYGEELIRLTNPLEVIELRLILEPSLARLASLRASPFEIARIADAASTQDHTRSGEVDLTFHMAIASAARNHLAGEFYKMLRQVGVDARVQVAHTEPATCPKRIGQRDSEHRLIADAIARRDPDAAEAAMRNHLLAVQKRIMERGNAGIAAA
ncbi:FadR/GntR family transcriptional regulator [Pseudaminobacter soli (ex Li et al. 2025)]|uniref:FadR family transcriptional regulator n=1 Tax=Pseudaminobacter soli (ex Li et al. 2025) TaxID=1295366 RepID=A0A2P7S9G7_9HYPH|nr:FCD domain-containing protein [Mesorhizobium soli]PSJ58955.1 FadR family transcriptional regulator [Mesorhizobium soli]